MKRALNDSQQDTSVDGLLPAETQQLMFGLPDN
jgi:hypothetical protein